MNALILFSHGSLLCGAGEALDAHADRLRRTGAWDRVAVGYMNYSAPTFAETVAECAARGATEILVLPFFLVPGYFVTKSLPECLEAARAAHPELKFTVADAIGFDAGLADALIASAQAPARPGRVARRPRRRRARLPRPPGLPAVRHAELPPRPRPGHARAAFRGVEDRSWARRETVMGRSPRIETRG